MLLENYEMKVYGENNQLVCLERFPTDDFIELEETGKGWSPLIVNTEEILSLYPVKLYLPKGSNEFVIIRK